MEPYRGKVGLDPKTRPKNTQEILKNIFSKVDCLECGICCKNDDGQSVIVLGSEPNRNKIFVEAKKQASKCIVKQRILGAFSIESPDSCVFLDDGKQKKCAIYDFRPTICALFPFIGEVFKTTTGKHKSVEMKPTIVLTSLCPAIRSARDSGISFIAQDEIALTKIENGKMKYEIQIPMLGESLRMVHQCMESKLMVSDYGYIKMPGFKNPVFPIL
jgi:Fe-S-cluster containining protein